MSTYERCQKLSGEKKFSEAPHFEGHIRMTLRNT